MRPLPAAHLSDLWRGDTRERQMDVPTSLAIYRALAQKAPLSVHVSRQKFLSSIYKNRIEEKIPKRSEVVLLFSYFPCEKVFLLIKKKFLLISVRVFEYIYIYHPYEQ